MIITKTCNTCEHYLNDKHCIGCEWDKSKGENTKWELKKNPIVIERAVLDKIRAEIADLPIRPEYQQSEHEKVFIDATNRALQIIDKYKGDKE